jgi:hypothetical protein
MVVGLLAVSGGAAQAVAQSALVGASERAAPSTLGPEPRGPLAPHSRLAPGGSPLGPGSRLAPGGSPFDSGRTHLAPAALSALVPGAGQLLALEQRRGWAYLALEALGWIVYADRRASGGRYRDRYRDLAWEVARLGDGPRVDGDFEFYERMSSWRRSGLFDADPGTPGLQPEPDPSTFNGSVWQRARGIYSVMPGQGPDDPAYRAALDYYASNAYADAFRWDWSDNAEALERFDGLIHESDERFRQATVALGAVIANHLVSAVDAYVSARGLALRVAPERGGGAGGVQVTLRWTPLR